jgi:redox-sensitive bicupin YhaK (pirin superfamily)
VSNLDTRPEETVCRTAAETGAVAELFEAREVPLGGLRGMQVQRLLPQRALPTVGAWCFLDQFGRQGGVQMQVLPHPHIGLQTVTWPLAGEIRHRDSVGSDVVVLPRQLNLMTAGHGVAHSEFSLGNLTGLHGLQLWVALPADRAGVAPSFEQHLDLPVVDLGGARVTVLIGSLAGETSPATAFTPLLGADLELAAGSASTLPLRPDYEHALVVVSGELTAAGTTLAAGPLLYLGTGRTSVSLSSPAGARAILLGGEPFPDDLVMWWNFVGRSHDEIVAARDDWENRNTSRFPHVPGHGDERVPAPALPGVHLKPRRRS